MSNIELMSNGVGTEEEYVKELQDALESKYKGKYVFEYKETDGLNGTRLKTLIATDISGREVFLIPVEDAYENLFFIDFDEIFENICHHIEQMENFYASEDMSKAVAEVAHPWLINKDMNKDLLHRCPHSIRGDYAIVYRLCTSFSSFQRNYGILFWKDMETYLLDCEWFYNQVIDNVQDTSLYKVIRFDNGYPHDVYDFSYREENKCNKYLVQGMTPYCANGSLFCTNLWKKIGEMIGENYYIYPSSVHEWEVVSCSKVTKEELANDVSERNEGLLPEHVLGKEFYLYDVKHSSYMCCNSDFDEE